MKTIKVLLALGAASSVAGSPAFAHEGHPQHRAKAAKARTHAPAKKSDASMSNMSAEDMKKMNNKPR